MISGVIFQWEQTGGVLLMGYEIFRMMATRAQRKKRDKNGNGSGGGTGSGANKKQNGNKSHNQAQPLCVDLEEEDRDKLILDSKLPTLYLSTRVKSYIFDSCIN